MCKFEKDFVFSTYKVYFFWFTGRPKEIWCSWELAKRIHNGRCTNPFEKRDGVSPQSQTCPTPRRYLFLGGEEIVRML